MHRALVIFVGLATLFPLARAASADPAVAVDPGVALERVARSPSLVSQPIAVFLQTRDVAATRRAVERAGGRIGTIAGDVVTARLPLDAVGRLGNAGVMRVEAARAVKPRLERALPEIGADQVHVGAPPLPGPVNGAGVIVGVIDIGLDLTHPAFQHASGTTRLISLWDQTATGTPPGSYDYGDECDAAEIDAKMCAHAAEAAHGTHVTGIAAGGAVKGVPYVGLAPEADLVFVNLGEPPGAASETEAISTAICDGVAYIFARADERGQPAVINMSLGMHGDPHDGGSLASRCLDNLTGPGRILVAAAGNEGQGSAHPVFGDQVQVHASAVASRQPQRVAFLVPPGQQDVFVYFDEGSNLAIKIGAMAPAGGRIVASNPVVFTPPVTVDTPLEPTTLSVGGKTLGSIAGAGGVLDTGVRGIQIRVADDDSDNAEAQVVWVLEMIGNGRFDAFIDTTGGGGFLRLDALPVAVDSAMTIGYPAVSARVLAVASYVTRSEWVTADGVMHTQTNALTGEPVVVGERSAFSSRGPSRNPAVTGPKPDIAAPGELIASALNHLAASSEPAERILVPPPGGYLLQEGTSMASPVVTGVVALMLDVDPELDVDRIREIFGATAALPEDGYAEDWGRGKIDAFTAVLAADPGDSGGKYDHPGERSTSGCGCHVPGSPGGIATVLLIAAVGLWVTRRRRR